MKVALKVWRYDSASGERALKEYEFDAPEEATLLDCLDIVKDKHDGSLAYRKSCRMMICGSCGMRMDGAAVLACKTQMREIAEAGHVPVISAMGNLPIVRDLVVDMTPFWQKLESMKPYLQPGYDRPEDGREYRIPQERMNVIHKEELCINCGCCVSECNAMESDPEFLGPQALAKGMRWVGDPRDGATVERLEQYSGEHGIWEARTGSQTRPTAAGRTARCHRHSLPSDVNDRQGNAGNQGVSTSTARDADRVPDALGVHRVRTFRQASKIAADRAYGFSVFTRRAPGLARAVWPWRGRCR